MKAVVIGASTGGPKMLNHLLTQLPAKLPAVVIVVQHIPKRFSLAIAKRLEQKTSMTFTQMTQGDRLLPGHIYIVPGDSHFFLSQPWLEVYLLPAQLTSNHPSIDMAFTSVAEAFGPNTIGVVLSGMGKDGVLGSKAIKQLGGHVIVQDEESSVVFGMPKAVNEAGYADEVLPVEKISSRIVELVQS